MTSPSFDRPLSTNLIQWERLPWEEKTTIMWSVFWRVMVVGWVVAAAAYRTLAFVFSIMQIASDAVDPFLSVLFLTIVIMLYGFLAIGPLIRWITSASIGDYRIAVLKRTVMVETLE